HPFPFTYFKNCVIISLRYEIMKRKYARKKKSSKKTLLIIIISLSFVLLIAVGGFLFAKRDKLNVGNTGSRQKVATEAIKKDEKIHIYTEDGESYIEAIEGMPRNPYSDENFFIDDYGFKAYKDSAGKKISEVGIDISSYQGDIDWKMVKKAGVDYVMLRCGGRGYGQDGVLYEDTKFEENAKEALDAGLEVGVYFFSQAITEEEAIEEAQYALEKIKDFKITYPVAFDWEVIDHDTARTDNMGRETLTDMALAFCEEIKKAGYVPMLYSSRHLLYFNYDMARLKDIDLWIASYGETPKFYYNFAMWQYSTDGTMYGIEGKVDLNINLYQYN
ncbi:MAG: glycoside hydrolase family 25 protein, partial [Acutalibacteraceae bacterium]